MSDKERCPECGRPFEKVWDRRGKNSPKSDYVYGHESVETPAGTSWRDTCYSDDPPEAVAW